MLRRRLTWAVVNGKETSATKPGAHRTRIAPRARAFNGRSSFAQAQRVTELINNEILLKRAKKPNLKPATA
jgi:hypothetical protein